MRQKYRRAAAADRDVADESMKACGIADMVKNVTMKGIDANAERSFPHPALPCIASAHRIQIATMK